jgi:hypothetical protein
VSIKFYDECPGQWQLDSKFLDKKSPFDKVGKVAEAAHV